MTIDITTTVHLFVGHVKNPLDLGEPEWTGTMEEFWKTNQEAYLTWGNMRLLIDELDEYHHAHIGAGAEAGFTICTASFLAAASAKETASTEAAPGPVTGLHHGPALADQLRLIAALAGTADKRGHQDQRDAVAYVETVAADMLAALKEAEHWIVAELAGRLDVEPLANVRDAIAKAEGRANG